MAKELVYIVDDDKIASLITQRMLSSIDPDLDVNVFSNPGDALGLILEEGARPTHIFLDLNMPTMNGWQFLDRIDNSIDTKCMVYILTSSIDDRDSEKAELHQYVSGYLVKPVNKDVLIKALKQN